MDDTKTYTGTICVVLIYVDENSCKNVEPTLFQTSEGVTHEDNHDVTPRTPVRNKARTYEDGNPSNIQTQENPDHQSKNLLLVLIGKTTPIKSEPERTLCSPSGNATFGQGRLKLSPTVSEVKEEFPEDNVYKENWVERNKILQLQQNGQELLRSNTLKDEELKTERKQNEEKSAIIESLKTKSDEGVKKTKELEAEIARLKEEIKNLKICQICTCEEKQYVIIPCGHYGLCQNCFDEEDYYFNNKCPFCSDEITDYEIENLKICQICCNAEKQYVIRPCGHYGLCQNCFDKKDSYERKCPFCRNEITGYLKVL